jgi:prepilin-type N-terminal cleavage/methylation domain-containing protein
MTQSFANIRFHRQSGFSLVELLVVVGVLTIVLAIAMGGIVQLQKRSNADTGRVDATQMTRQFMDQIINDLHQSGYPGSRIYDPATLNPNNVAAGLLSVTPTSVEFEGDVDASGNVSHEVLQLLWSDGSLASGGAGTCPCTLQRGILYKPAWAPGAVPFYTELNNVLLPANSPGIFEAYTSDGKQVTLPAVLPGDLKNINVIKITVNMQSTVPEMDGMLPTITMASEAKISNVNN